MGKKGGSRHLKRYAAPPLWPISVKKYKWVTRPRPGPHPLERCCPLLVVVRDALGYAKTAREAKYIIKRGLVTVDGRVRRDHKFPVGVMDVVGFPSIGEYYRVLVDRKHFVFHRIDDEEAKFKICSIRDKSTVKGGHIQLHLHDGRNVLIRVSDPRNPVEDVYKTGDSLKIGLPDQQVLKHLRLEPGALAFVIGGGNRGILGEVVEVIPGTAFSDPRVRLRTRDGKVVETIKEYVIVVGEPGSEPEISFPEKILATAS